MVEVPTENEEIIREEILPNEPMKKEIKEPDVIKDEEDEEDIEDINKKEEIDKINIPENICSPKNIDLHNPVYLRNNRKEDNVILKLLLNYPEINPIETQLFYYPSEQIIN